MTASARIDRLLARQEATLSDLGERRRGACPGGLVPLQRAAAAVVLDHVPADRADRIIAAYADAYLRASVDDVHTGTATDALAVLDATTLPTLRSALGHLLSPPEGVTGWGSDDVHALLARHPTPLALHDASILGPSLPMPGLFAHQRRDLLTALEAGTPPAVLTDRHLLAPLLHGLARGPQRDWEGGWPAWTMLEAAVTHVQRRCVPAHLFPTTPAEGLGGFRTYANLGALLALWRGERAVWSAALDATSPHDGLGERLGTIASLADLQAWRERGGANLGPALANPVHWLKLMASVQFGGPLASTLRAIAPGTEITWALAGETDDLLAAAGRVPWTAMPCFRRPFDVDGVRDVIEAGVAAMFVEDRTLHAMHACPADPPGGVLTLDTEACTLSAAPRAHRQYTEPATWVMPPAWCGALHARGLRVLTLTGCTAERRATVGDALVGLAHSEEPLTPHTTLDLGPADHQGPTAVTTPPAPLQVRPADGVLAVGAPLAHTLAEALFAAHVHVVRSPFGAQPDPMTAARALRALAGTEPLAVDDVTHDGHAWVGAWHDPALSFPARTTAFAWLAAQLAAARASLPHAGLLLLSWGQGHHHANGMLLDVAAIVEATTAALTALRAVAPQARVVLVIDPTRDPALPPSQRHDGQAVLRLAARRLAHAGLVEVLHAPELVADDLGDAAWADDGTTLSPAATEALLTHLLAGWYAPTARAWITRFRADPADPWLADHPFLPRPGPSPVREPLPTGEPETPAPASADFDDTAWRARFTDALDVGSFLRFDAQRDWLVGITALLAEIPPDHTATRLAALAGLDDKREDLEDPSQLAPAYARLVRDVLPTGDWPLDDMVPPLKRALARHWLDDLDAEIAALDEATRAELAERLLDGKRAPREGQVLRTPLERAVMGLLGG